MKSLCNDRLTGQCTSVTRIYMEMIWRCPHSFDPLYGRACTQNILCFSWAILSCLVWSKILRPHGRHQFYNHSERLWLYLLLSDIRRRAPQSDAPTSVYSTVMANETDPVRTKWHSEQNEETPLIQLTGTWCYELLFSTDPWMPNSSFSWRQFAIFLWTFFLHDFRQHRRADC